MQKCIYCPSSDAFAVYEDGNKQCFSCGTHEFPDGTWGIQEEGNWMSKKSGTAFTEERKHAGFVPYGVPVQLSIIRSFKNALARNIAMEAAYDEEIEELKKTEGNDQTIEELENLKTIIPFLDDIDLRFKLITKHKKPKTKAVMFCVMDVSGSMDEEAKETAKRLYILLYLFLNKLYAKDEIELVFIRYHTTARTCTEHDFFYAKDTGGTNIAPALELVAKAIKDKYSPVFLAFQFHRQQFKKGFDSISVTSNFNIEICVHRRYECFFQNLN